MAFHTFVMSGDTNDVGLPVYRLFSFPACWLAGCLSVRFARRLSEALSNWYNGNKSGVGNFINNKQWKMTPSALHFQMALETCVHRIGFAADCAIESSKIHTCGGSHGFSRRGEPFPKLLNLFEGGSVLE